MSNGASTYGTDLVEQQQLLFKMTQVMLNPRVINHHSLLPFQKGVIISNKSLTWGITVQN